MSLTAIVFRFCARIFCLLIVIAASIGISAAQQTTPVASETRVGETQRLDVPHATEPWSITAQPPSETVMQQKVVKAEEEALDVPGFEQAKQAANARKLAAMRASGTASSTATPDSAAAATGAATSIVASTFAGPAAIPVPPDEQIAAGPAHLVTAINTQLDIYSKTGTHLSTTTSATFFSSVLTGGFLTDPRVLYDQANGRFFLIVSEHDATGNTATETAHILLAVSQTSDPTGVWDKYALNWMGRSLDNVDNTWPDFPTLGVSSTAIYIASDQVAFSAGVEDEWITVIDLPELLSGSASLTMTRFTDVKTPAGDVTMFVQPALTYGALSTEYLISSDANPNAANLHGPVGRALHLFKINTAGTPTLTAVDVPVATYGVGPNAVQAGGTQFLINTGGPALEDGVVVVNGSLWCTQSVLDSTGTKTVIRWYQIDPVTATVQQTGTINGVDEAYYGAIAVTPANEVSVVYTTSSTTQFASAGYARRTASDPPGTMPTTGVFQAGDGVVGEPRWGDYNGISLDPDGSTVWGLAEWESNFDSSQIVQLIPSGSTPPPPPPSCTAGASSVNICTPAAGSTVASPIAISAAANGGTVAISAMKAYLDNVLVASGTSGSLTASVNAAAGSHTLTVNAWNKNGTLFQKKSTFAVSGTGGGVCAKPASTGVKVCAPLNGSSVTSPVTISASANGGATAITAMKAYIGGVQVASSTSGSLTASVKVAVGAHTLNVNAWNTAGTVFTFKGTFTVH